MRSEVLDEPNHAGSISNRDVFCFPENSLVQNHRVCCNSQFLILTEPGNAYQHVTMFTGDERRVDAQMTSNGRLGPAGAKRSPWAFQSFKLEVPEVSLQKLTNIIAELHMKVSIEHRCLLALFGRYGGWIPENI